MKPSDTPRTDAVHTSSIPNICDHPNAVYTVPVEFARQLERENNRLRELWTEARVVVAKSRDANCCISYGTTQVDAVEACNAWLNKMPT